MRRGSRLRHMQCLPKLNDEPLLEVVPGDTLRLLRSPGKKLVDRPVCSGPTPIVVFVKQYDGPRGQSRVKEFKADGVRFIDIAIKVDKGEVLSVATSQRFLKKAGLKPNVAQSKRIQ